MELWKYPERTGLTMKQQLKDLCKDIWNVPNVLTMIRLALVPIFAIVYLDGYPHRALAIFCLASFTDCLDGLIARKYHLITSFGKLMDPLADKLMVLTAMVCMGITKVFPWDLIIIVGVKEVVLVIGSFFMLKHNIVVSANIVGKTATVTFILALLLGFLNQDFIDRGWHPQAQPVLMIAVGMAICSLIFYYVEGWKKLYRPEQREEPEEPKE